MWNFKGQLFHKGNEKEYNPKVLMINIETPAKMSLLTTEYYQNL
jgi:hypothetical protein